LRTRTVQESSARCDAVRVVQHGDVLHSVVEKSRRARTASLGDACDVGRSRGGRARHLVFSLAEFVLAKEPRSLHGVRDLFA
jgi:hypothetical protein